MVKSGLQNKWRALYMEHLAPLLATDTLSGSPSPERRALWNEYISIHLVTDPRMYSW